MNVLHTHCSERLLATATPRESDLPNWPLQTANKVKSRSFKLNRGHHRSFLLGLEIGEGANLKKMNGAVELLLGTLFFVLGSSDSNSHFSWNVSASSGPEEVV